MATSTKKFTPNLKWFNTTQPFPKKYHAYFLKTVAELLEQGFSIQQALVFMQLLMKKYHDNFQLVIDKLGQGEPFEKSIECLGYRIPVMAQLFYAQRQGRFIAALKDNAEHLQRIHDYKTKILKLLSYPLLMGCFLVALLFGMREFMLPHILGFIEPSVYEKNRLIQLLVLFFTYLPQLFLGLGAFLLISVLAIDMWLMKGTYFWRYQVMCRIPIVKKWTRWFCTQKVSKELGYFFEAGYSLQQLLEVIIKYPIDPFLTELAHYLWQGLSQGEPLTDLLQKCRFFTAEFGLIIYQGELTSQVATKCRVYADKLLNDLMQDISKKIGYIQPLLFIVIAVLVMAMYLMMLLPMLTMEGF